jgi:general secretion pathway protein G
LIEVLIVVAIMALIAAGVAMAVMGPWEGAKKKAAATSAHAIREGVKGYWALQEGTGCPTVGDLIGAGILDEASARKDPWGTPFHIECSGASVTVTSYGPDRTAETADDIRIPPRES